MIQPVADQAAQEIRPAQERAVSGGRPAKHEVVAAARARVAAVQHELLGRQAQRARVGVERFGLTRELAPARRGPHVHLEHARIRRHAHLLDPRIEGHRVALDQHRTREAECGVLDRGEQLEIVVGARERRHEYAQVAVALLHAQRGAHDAVGRVLNRRHHTCWSSLGFASLRAACASLR
jgi:hypothetical protein